MVEGVVVEEQVSVSVLVEEVAAVLAEAAVARTSVDRLARRKAERRLKHQQESLYPRLVGDHYCG